MGVSTLVGILLILLILWAEKGNKKDE